MSLFNKALLVLYENPGEIATSFQRVAKAEGYAR